jgi:hypothetical protein
MPACAGISTNPGGYNTMTEKQESQWLYAKALELAIRIKGPYQGNTEITKSNASSVILRDYDPLVQAIAQRIRAGLQPEMP